MPGRGAHGVVAVADQGHIEQEQPGLGADRVDLRQIVQAAARHRGDRVARALLEHGLPGELEIGAELGLEEADIQERAVIECDLHHVRGLEVDMGPGQAPLVAGALQPGAVQLPERDALGLRCGEHQGQIEGRLVLRVHGAARPGHPLGVLGADVGIALEVLVDDGEPGRQVDLLGPGLDERLALGIDGDEVLLWDHPAGRTAALLELQLVIALDRIEGVGGRQQLERAAGADLAGDAEAVHLVGELGDVEVGGGEPDALAQGRDHVAQQRAVVRAAAGQPLLDAAAAGGGVERAGAGIEAHDAARAREAALARDQAAVVGRARDDARAAHQADLAVGEPCLVGQIAGDRDVPDDATLRRCTRPGGARRRGR